MNLLGRKMDWNNPDDVREHSRKYKKLNKDKIKINWKKYYEKNKDRLRKKGRERDSERKKKNKCVDCGIDCRNKRCWSCWKKFITKNKFTKEEIKKRAKINKCVNCGNICNGRKCWNCYSKKKVNEALTKDEKRNRTKEYRENNKNKIKKHYENNKKAICIICGKPAKIKFCSIKCMGVGTKGENASNWQGGKSFEPYDKNWTERFKRQIRKRDAYLCMMCNRHQNEFNRSHCVHHVDGDKMNTTEKNCISLCLRHHMIVEGSGKAQTFWMFKFQKMLSKLYGYKY